MDGFEGVHGGNGIEEQKFEGAMLLEFCGQDICVANIWFKKRKMTYSSGGNEIDFVLVEKESRKFLKDVKVVPWELQHRSVVVDVKKKPAQAHKMKRNMQWRAWKYKENKGKI